MGDVTFVFERLDVTVGPRLIASTFPGNAYVREFRTLNAKHPVQLLEFDPRAADHPDRLAEEAVLREELRAARQERRRRPSA